MTDLPTELDADSEDLSDAEVETATLAPTVDKVILALKGKTCAVCSEPLGLSAHELRRRTPFFYWRVRSTCPNGHGTLSVFRADWLSQ